MDNAGAVINRPNNVEITRENAGQRFDKFLLKYMNKAGKGFVYKMLRKKRVKLNGARAEGNELLKVGDVVTFYISPETMGGLFEERGVGGGGFVDVIFEDENVLFANKPSGLLTHSEKQGDDTLIDRVIHYLVQKGEYVPSVQGAFAPVCCNRLDRNTSGIVVCAKNLPAAQALNAAFKARNTEKYYSAVVVGKLNKKIVINEPVDGKDALTEIEPIRSFSRSTLVSIRLHTGRTHQIRVHLQSAGYPIIGDPKYGDTAVNKFYRKHGITSQLLHAARLVVNDGGVLSYLNGRRFKAELPEEFAMFLT